GRTGFASCWAPRYKAHIGRRGGLSICAGASSYIRGDGRDLATSARRYEGSRTDRRYVLRSRLYSPRYPCAVPPALPENPGSFTEWRSERHYSDGAPWN